MRCKKIRGIGEDTQLRKAKDILGKRNKVGRPGGYRLSKETREKIAASRTNKKHTKAARGKIKAALLEYHRINRIDVAKSSVGDLRALQGVAISRYYFSKNLETHCINGKWLELVEICLIVKKNKFQNLVRVLLSYGWKVRKSDLTIWSKGGSLAARIVKR